MPRKRHTGQGVSDGCDDGDETGRIRHRHQSHPRPFPSRQPTAAKVQTGTECLTFSAKTSADGQPDAQPTYRRINRHQTAATSKSSPPFTTPTTNRDKSHKHFSSMGTPSRSVPHLLFLAYDIQQLYFFSTLLVKTNPVHKIINR